MRDLHWRSRSVAGGSALLGELEIRVGQRYDRDQLPTGRMGIDRIALETAPSLRERPVEDGLAGRHRSTYCLRCEVACFAGRTAILRPEHFG